MFDVFPTIAVACNMPFYYVFGGISHAGRIGIIKMQQPLLHLKNSSTRCVIPNPTLRPFLSSAIVASLLLSLLLPSDKSRAYACACLE
jgi:hypothetical protein